MDKVFLQDGVLQAKQLLTTLDMIVSASLRKIHLLESILQTKIADIGGSVEYHSCLSNFI